MKEIERNIIGLNDILKEKKEEEIKEYLSSFSCELNPSVEKFIHNTSLENEKKSLTRSFLVVDPNVSQDEEIIKSNIIGFFAFYVKSFVFDNDVSKTCKKKLGGGKDSEFFPCLLICQFARSDQYRGVVDGSVIMDDCLTIANNIYHLSGLRIVCVEYDVNNPELDKFYLDEKDSHGNTKKFKFTYLQTEEKTSGKQILAYLRL